MRRNHFSLILPSKRSHSISSLNSTRSYHFIRSAERNSLNQSFYEDSFSLKRRKSSIRCAHYIVIEYSSTSNPTRSNHQFIHAGTSLELTNKTNSDLSNGETLFHLSSRLGHEYILRRLIEETPYGTRLTNSKGQTPLLCAIQSSHSSTAIFLMDIDPITITVCDEYLNSISGIIYGIDFNQCTRQTGIRCNFQWQIGSIGLLSVWISLLFVFMKGIKSGKYGLLFLTVLFTFIKFIIFYSFIWIGFYLVFYLLLKDLFPQFNSFYLIPKLLVMFIGEFDFDETFFPNQNPIKGSEGALFVYSIFIFTMFIVMSNIMAGLAVADVKEFRLNAKREHLRCRIETILQVQRNFGFLCEICSKITLKFLNNNYLNKYIFKYDMSRVKFLNRTYEHFGIETTTGLIKSNNFKQRGILSKKSFLIEKNPFIKNENQFEEYFQESILKIQSQLKTIHLQLKTDIQELKLHLDQIISNNFNL
ncbi:hypothetical protein I4U23_017270 [Adineta vaga]|nr:hypothetical protein I4U23_017270 [Adineta vaga]